MENYRITYDINASLNGDFWTFVRAESELEAAKLAEEFVKGFCDGINKSYENDKLVSLKLDVNSIWVGSKQIDGILQKEEARKLKESIKQEA